MTDMRNEGNFDESPPVAVEEYDRSIRLFCGAYEEIFRLSYCCLRATLREDAQVLVVGVGTGMELTSFGPLSPGWSFCGVDPSHHMLALAKKKISQCPLTNLVRFEPGYVEDLEDSEKFDAATAILVMHFLKDDGSKLSFLKNIHKHLKIGAPLILVDGFGEPGTPAFAALVNAWKQFPCINGVDRPSVEEAFNQVILKKIQFVPETRIVSLLEQAGFTRVCKYYTGFLYGGWMAYR